MAPRLSKRQQREQEELLSLANNKPSATEQRASSSEEEGQALLASVAPAKTGFAALFTPEDGSDPAESDDDEHATKPAKSRKAKKRKKKAAAIVQDDEATKSASSPLQAAPQAKSTSKKAKAKAKKDEKDDLDRALEELSIKYPDLQQIAQSTSSDTRSTKLSALFSVSVPHLDAESELKKFFGPKAISAAEAATSTPLPDKKRRGVQPQMQRSQLTRPRPSWGMIKQWEGLSARQLTDDETARKANPGPAGPGKWWSVEYSKRYKGVTKTFTQAVMTGDFHTLWRIPLKMPWHADTLLQLAEIYRQQEEYGKAVDFMSRALYAYERAFIGAFSFTSGSNRLDFDHAENRPFFLAIHRQVIDLQRRGCPRTAFEHARLLVSLDPVSDPHGAYLYLDYLSVKAGMGDWLLDVCVLPGWSYARALILRIKEMERKSRGEDFKEESTEALRQAILEFPSIIPLLADKCEVSLSSKVRGDKAFRIYTDRFGLMPEENVLHLLSHLYAHRSSQLWKSSDHASWLASTVDSLLPTLSAQRTQHPTRDRFLHTFTSFSLQHSIYRHVFVLDQTQGQPQTRSLMAFVAFEATTGRNQLACDPFPPPSAVSTYDAAFFAGCEDPEVTTRRGRRRTQAEERVLAQLIPDAAARAQILALYDDDPWLAAQVPGAGVVEFVQAMAQLPEEQLEELIVNAVMMREAVGGAGPGPGPDADAGAGAGVDVGAMPGGFLDENVEVFLDANDAEGNGVGGPPGPPPQDQESVSGTEEEDEELEDVAPMPIRVVRNLLSRLWGGAPAQEDSSGEE